MKTIVFLGTQKSGSSREAIKAAEQLGYFTCVLTDNPKQLSQREEYYDVHLMIYCNLKDIESIRLKINQLKQRSLIVKAIISFIDPYCPLASQLSEEYNLHSFTTEALSSMQNKLKSRECLKDTPYIPQYKVVKADNNNFNNIGLSLPVVLKYIDSNGSKDVYLCADEAEYQKKYQELIAKYPDGTFLVEEYLNGPQYLVEVLVCNGVKHIVAVIKQEVSIINKHFIVTGYQLLIDLDEEMNYSLEKAITTIIDKHGLKNGPCHLELRLVANNWKLIEINPRIAGAGMNLLIKFGYGINLVRETIKLSLKKPVYLNPIFKRHTYSKYLTVEKQGKLFRITGRKQAMKMPGVKYIYLKPKKGSTLIPPVSMGNRYAYIIANGKTAKEAENNAISAASIIKFHLFNKAEIIIKKGDQTNVAIASLFFIF